MSHVPYKCACNLLESLSLLSLPLFQFPCLSIFLFYVVTGIYCEIKIIQLIPSPIGCIYNAVSRVAFGGDFVDVRAPRMDRAEVPWLEY